MKTEVTLERLEEFTTALERGNVPYVVIAGFGLDGKRGLQTRPHQDLDVLCLKKDKDKVDTILSSLRYAGPLMNDTYKLKRSDGSKIDLTFLTEEGDDLISYGKTHITRFPRQMFSPQKAHIGTVSFSIAPNELLYVWGRDCPKGDDANYAKTLPIDEQIVSRISRQKQDHPL
ncbi:MAG: hypothetical protein V1725_04110 [archaeon]